MPLLSKKHKRLEILIVEDSSSDLDLIKQEIKRGGILFVSRCVDTKNDFLAEINKSPPDIILSDYSLPDFDGLAALAIALERIPNVPFIMVTGSLNEEIAIECMKAGADDYVMKEHLNRLSSAIKQAMAKKFFDEEHQQSQKKLQASEKRFQQLARNISEGFWVSNVDRSKISYVSHAIEKMWGFSADDLYKKPSLWLSGIHKDDRKRVEKAFAQNAKKDLYDEEYRLVKNDESEIWIRDRGSPVWSDNGEIYRIVGIAEDITERKKAEKREEELNKKLIRAERMESLCILAGGVAHDLNNILSPLLGYPDMILQDIPKDNPCREYVNEIKRSAKRAADTIQDLLCLARRGNVETALIDLNHVISSQLKSATLLELQKDNPRITMNVDLSPGELIIEGSEIHLARLLINLAVNAFEAMSKGGKLFITTASRHLDAERAKYEMMEKGDYASLRIRDTGKGIEQEDVERIFEPFYTKKKKGRSGSGLGLTAVYGIINDLNGYIDVKTQVNEGTEFILHFPLSSKVAIADTGKPKKEEKISGGAEKILVVDDKKEQRQLAKGILTRLGYKVETAENGHDAIKKIKKEPVELLLLDMIMEEDFDGLDAYEEILKTYPHQKCVIVSGYARTDRTKKARSLGAEGYLAKPYAPNDLARAVRQELDKPTTSGITGLISWRIEP